MKEKGERPDRTERKEGEEQKTGKESMHRGRRLRRHLPWLALLLGLDGFAVLLLWIADAEAFRALLAVVALFSMLLTVLVLGVLEFLERRREQAFLAFLALPDEYHEELLAKRVGAARADFVRLLAGEIRERQRKCNELSAQLAGYEEYVEAWAHEAKIPLSLLTLLLDNRREELPETVGFKLDYIRSRLREYTDQMLYYARIKGTHKDYRFEHVDLNACIGEVLEDYSPLLEEKGFAVSVPEAESRVYTDYRGLRFLLAQVVSNAVKYSGKDPELIFSFEKSERESILHIRDNGTGVKECDLPFLFEKGFTGDSGGDRKKATGMGLYLAKEMAGELNITLCALSEWGKGFEMRIAFPRVEE